MTEERPRPKYGELAPEGWSWTPPKESAGEREIIEHDLGTPAPPPEPAPQASAISPQRLMDRWATIVLLVLGILSTLNSVPSYWNLSATLSQVFAQQGWGQFTAVEVGDRVGQIAAIAQILVLLGSIAISVLLLRRGRIAFYVPLTGAFLTILISLVCMAIALFSDPATARMFMTAGV